jgi:hypothetical protein
MREPNIGNQFTVKIHLGFLYKIKLQLELLCLIEQVKGYLMHVTYLFTFIIESRYGIEIYFVMYKTIIFIHVHYRIKIWN